MWEEEYEEFLRDLGIVTQRNVVEHVVSDVRRNEAQFDVEKGEWKKHNARLIKLAEKIKFLVAINVFVMTVVVIVMICIFSVFSNVDDL
jgi:t-SNARE complex subunit (syntaxin)